MKLKNTTLPALLLFIASICYGEDITGIYRRGDIGSLIGIEIKTADIGVGYIVQLVYLTENDEIDGKWEWQAAFLDEADSKILFYWHTGRFDDSMPESNSIIVYELTVSEDKLEGYYYFPEEKRTPPASTTFYRVRQLYVY